MNNSESHDETGCDELLAVELQIARRADEISRSEPNPVGRHPLEHWQQAEEEVWVDCWRRENRAS